MRMGNKLIIVVLKGLIVKHGLLLIDDPIRLSGLLRDHCGDLKKEINLILFAQKEKVPHDILKISSKIVDNHQFQRFVSKLIDNCGLHETSSIWAVECWIKALGKDSQIIKVQNKVVLTEKPLPNQTPASQSEALNEKISVYNDSFQTIKIGKQIWMAENLNVDHYRNGDLIPQVQDPIQWNNLKTGAWCYYENKIEYGKIYGKLYNWFAVNDPRGLAPQSWHIPSKEEWSTLTAYLGGESVAGNKLKETGTNHWRNPNTGATNIFGFTALPGGYRDFRGCFDHIGRSAYFWSSTEYLSEGAWNYYLLYLNSNVLLDGFHRELGYSIRCLKIQSAP